MMFFKGYWDGFQFFGNKKRSIGVIEVFVVTMSKEYRFCIEEVYIVGFVLSYDFLDGRLNSFDFFLELLV